MVIDPSKVNLKERDIEDYLWLNPQIVTNGSIAVDRWIERQYEVPSGIIDLFGVTHRNEFVVVEVKNVDIEPSALTQVSRYAYDIFHIIKSLYAQGIADEVILPYVYRFVVGKGIDDKTMLEAESLNIGVLTFSVEVCVTTSPRRWKNDFLRRRQEKWNAMCSSDAIAPIVSAFSSQLWTDGNNDNGDDDDGGNEELQTEV